jgi:hypothetical protein
MRYNKLTKPGWWDDENYICESDMNMGLLNWRFRRLSRPK